MGCHICYLQVGTESLDKMIIEYLHATCTVWINIIIYYKQHLTHINHHIRPLSLLSHIIISGIINHTVETYVNGTIVKEFTAMKSSSPLLSLVLHRNNIENIQTLNKIRPNIP